MGLRRFRCGLVLALVLGGCRGSDGRFVTLAEWWAERNGRATTSEQPPPGRGTDEQTRPHQETHPSKDAAATRDRASSNLGAPPVGSVLPQIFWLNNEGIEVDDVLEPIRPQLERASKELPADEYHALLKRLVQQEIVEQVSERLIWQEAKRDLKEEQNKALEQVIDRVEQDRINADFGGRESRYERHLAEHRISRKDVRERLKRRLVVEQYLKDRLLPRVAVRKPDLVEYYAAHEAEFSRASQVEMFIIDVPFAAFVPPGHPPTEAEKNEARRRAREHVARCLVKIRAGDPFEAVARTGSFDPVHAADGGAWGMISQPLRGRYEAPSKAALAMKSGQVSEAIETPTACFLVKAGRVVGGESRRFEDVQGEIANRLKQEQFAMLRGRFIRRTLAQSAVGDLEPFIEGVIAHAPESAKLRALDKPEAEAGSKMDFGLSPKQENRTSH